MNKPSSPIDPTLLADLVLDSAETIVCAQGYGALTFARVAKEADVSQARIKRLFPEQADLTAAVARRATQRFAYQIGDPTVPAAVVKFVTAYRDALAGGDLSNLCGRSQTEGDAPGPVTVEARSFLRENIAWMEAALGRNGTRARAEAVVSALEGALALARFLDDPGVLDRVADEVIWS